MALVLDCLTDTAVYQVSDRRLMNPSTWKPVEDECNKAVVVDGRVALAYSGCFTMGGMRTDDWLARVIAAGETRSMSAVTERVRDAATAAFRQLHAPPELKRHAFRGVGWFRLPGEDWLSPGLVTVHNSYDQQTGESLSVALPEFKVAHFFSYKLPGGLFIKAVSVNPTDAERAAVWRHVHKAVRHKKATTKSVGAALISAFRWLSGRHVEIGGSLMLICIPQKAAQNVESTGKIHIRKGSP